MKSSPFDRNEPKNLHVVVALTSTILMLFIASDVVRSIDFKFISTFDFSGNNLRYAIFSILFVLTIIFWILSIINNKLGDATKFLFFFSLSIAGIYISNPSTSRITWDNKIEPLILVFIALIFIESIARLHQSEKRFKAEKQVSEITKIYYGSKFLKIFKNWLTPSFILLTFIGMLQIILNGPDYITQNFDLSGISQDRLKYYLASFVILFILVGIFITNSILKKIYSSMAVGDIEKKIEAENAYNKFIIVEKKKNEKLTFDWKSQNKVFAQAKYIAMIGLIVAFGGSNMNINQLYDNTLHFFDPSLNFQEHTFLNEQNEKIIDMEKNIYDIDDIIVLNESIWSYINV